MTVTANTSSTHNGIINITTGSAADTITGTRNDDTIVAGNGNDTIRGGDGDDELDGGAGADRFIFEATAAANSTSTGDVITGLEAGTGGDILDFSLFLSAGTVGGVAGTAFAEFATTNDDDYNITDKLVLFSTGGAPLTAANLILEIQGAGNAFALDAGGKAIVLTGNAAGGNLMNGFYVHDKDGDGIVETGEVEIVFVTAGNFDLDTLTSANIDIVA
jgi:Ca2+-binding RTX toxin-like protein